MARPKGYITRQAQRLSDGEINRRRFVMSALSAGVTMPTALSLASKAEAAVPKRGGILRVATAEGAATHSLSPDQPSNSLTRLMAFTRANALTEITAEGDVIGELADTFERSADAREWVFTLRAGIEFHDGTPLDAQQVVRTLTQQAEHLPEGSDLRADGPDRIVIRMPIGNMQLPRRLADPRFAILSPDDPKIGTGPYELTEFQPGQLARFIRNEAYWKHGRAHVDAVEIHILSDTVQRQQAVMAGDIDYADTIDPHALALLQRAPNLNILETTGTRHLALTHDGDGAALEPLVPSQALLDQVLLGHGRCSADLSSQKLPVLPSPFRLGLRDPSLPGIRETGRLIEAAARKVGVHVETHPLDAGPAHAEIGWTSDTNGAAYIAVWANDLAVHSTALTHGGTVGSDLENDGARLAERWWFA